MSFLQLNLAAFREAEPAVLFWLLAMGAAVLGWIVLTIYLRLSRRRKAPNPRKPHIPSDDELLR